MRYATVGRGETSQAVREAIGAFAAPDMRDQILGLALSIASLGDVPERIEELQQFIEGPLRTVVAGFLGEDVADAVAADLAPMLVLLTSQVRPRTPPRDEDTGVRRTPTPAPRAAAPLVLLATMNASRLEEFSAGLLGFAAVRVADHVFALAAALETAGKNPPLVVIDLEAAPFDAAGLVALAPLLPTGTRLVLWGDPTRYRMAIERLRRAGITFVSRDALASAEEVAELCRVFVAPS